MTEIMLAVCVCVGLVALGEIISYFTKAVIPSMAGALIIYLILIWIGMPTSYPEAAGFTYLGDFVLLAIVGNLGTSVLPSDYAKNIKSLLIAVGAVVLALVLCIGVGGLIFGFDTMLAGAGACCGGGAVAGIAAINKINALGCIALLAVPTVIICAVDPIGQPIASFILKKYANKLRVQDAYLLEKVANKDKNEEIRLTKHGVPFGSEDNPSNKFTNFIPIKLEEDGVIIFELSIAILLSCFMENLTTISSFVWVFLICLVACTFGVFRMNLLDRSHSAGLCNVILIAYLFVSMNEITPQSLLESIGPVIALIILSALGLSLGGGIVGKLLGYDFILSAAAGMGIFFLFPGVAIVSSEVSARNSRNEEERNFMYQKIAPSMYIVANGGFVLALGLTVTVLLPLLNNF